MKDRIRRKGGEVILHIKEFIQVCYRKRRRLLRSHLV